MKKIFLFCFVIAGISDTSVSISQTQKYSRVKIFTDGKGLKDLSASGVCIDHGDYKKNTFFISDFSEKEIGIIKSKGFKYEIQIPDVQQFYLDQNAPSSGKYVPPPSPLTHGCNSTINYPTPANFTPGSMGGFFTYAEILWHLDNMAALFPNLVKAKSPLDSLTVEGRPVYWLKISDNPNVDENEPEMLYTAVHHAREPASVSQLIMYMYYLLENYNMSAEVKYLVDNLEMYFVPCVNPDGYIHNETTNPNGGGMWRKNRKNNQDGTFGIDLNRNYGYNWGVDNNGSSPSTSSDTYRGDAAFSEPETQNMRDFCNKHQFKLTLNYHTYGNLLIYPWGYNYSTYTPDSVTFVEFGKHLTWQNHYNYGTADQTVGYLVNGSSDDWMYGEQSSKAKIFAMTPEAGDVFYGFWPPQSMIVSICKENISQNLHAAHLLLKYAIVTDDEPRYVSSANGFFNYKIKQLGLDASAAFTVSITPLSANLISVGSPKTYSSLSFMQEVSDSIAFTLNASITPGQVIHYVVSVDNGLYVHSDTIDKIYGQPLLVFSSNGNSMTGWTSNTGWGVDNSLFHSPSASISDSPGGNYNSNDSTFITTSSPFSLGGSGASSATLTFWARWETEPRFDYVEVLASSDGGSTWTPLCGKYSKPGNTYQDPGNPLYDGYQFEWFREEIDLDKYVNQNVLLRFLLKTDNGGDANGFFFDDLKVEKILFPMGVSEQSTNDFFSIFPNPSSGIFTLTSSEKISQIVITDVLGNQVCKSCVSDTLNVTVDLTSHPKGIYFIKAMDEKGNFGVKKSVLL